MSASPKYKIHDPFGKYVASCKEPDLAVRIVALLGERAKVRVNGKPVFSQDEDGDAAENIDAATRTLQENEARVFPKRSP